MSENKINKSNDYEEYLKEYDIFINKLKKIIPRIKS